MTSDRSLVMLLESVSLMPHSFVFYCALITLIINSRSLKEVKSSNVNLMVLRYLLP